MWWFIKKQLDDTDGVVYSYGYESREQTGKICYNRKEDKCDVLIGADNDSNPLRVCPYVRRVILNENAPVERQIATG